jgi:hypothetical protein
MHPPRSGDIIVMGKRKMVAVSMMRFAIAANGLLVNLAMVIENR